jgi:diguanylate cyclase (GGDEF)-like protein
MDLSLLNRASLDSPYAKELERGFPMLKFAGLLEKEFRDFYISQNMSRARLSALIALLLVVGVTVIEAVFGGFEPKGAANLLRLAVLCPSLALIVATTYFPALSKNYEAIVSASVLVTGVTTIYISQIAALDGASYLLSGVVLVSLYACLFLGLQFYIGVATTAILIVAHLIIGAAVGLPLNVLLYTSAIVMATSVIGSISTYKLETALRTSFLETRLLNELAQRDGLTGLYNRRIFDDYIKRVWRQSRREKQSIEILMIDIDYFKIYNDLYGHQAGDDCLKAVARTISQAAKRPFDFCARYGGEEFILVLYGPPADYARSLPEQLSRDIMDLAIEHRGSNVDRIVTVSIGVAIAHASSGRSLVGAIQAADEALYEAKRDGRNRVTFRDACESEIETGNFRVSQRRAN